ncbi:MAG: thioredoxin domain-containing protein [Ardenticatenaceae bacterium]
MKILRFTTVFWLSLILMLFLSGCGQERIVYVPVTVTPDGGSNSAESDEGALPPALQVEEQPATPEAVAPKPTAVAETEVEAEEAAGTGNAEAEENVEEEVAAAQPEAPQAEAPQAEAPQAETEAPQAETEAEAEGEAPQAAEPVAAAVENPNILSSEGQIERVAFMGPFGQSQALQVYVMNPDGSGLKSLTEELGEGYFPSLSPDGKRVALVSNTSVDPDIFVVDVASNEATNLTNTPGFDNQPTWSPDGKQIAFITDRDGGDTDIWVMDADGSNPRRLASNPGQESMGGWSADSSKIVFSTQNEVGEALWIMDVKSGETTQLTESVQGRLDNSPSWSPDGKLIAFHSSESNGPPAIYTIQPDGSQRQQVSQNNVPAVFPIWRPDSQTVIYTEVLGDKRNMKALKLTTNEVANVPSVQGFGGSWKATDELLVESGYTQGPRMTGVEVNPTILEAAYKVGSPDAPVTIVEFSDYQCPFCQRWYNDVYLQLKPYLEDGTVQLIFVDFPLNIHAQAPAAAQAAHCGGELGGTEAYWKMHDTLFINMNQWSGVPSPGGIFNELASNAGLDGNAVQECVESQRFSGEVNAGLQEGIRLGITGTPTFFVNGTRLVGAQPWDAFEPYLNQGG